MAQIARRATAPSRWGGRLRIRPSQMVLHACLAFGALIMIFPLVWMAFSVLKSEAEIISYPPALLPKNPTLEPLRDVWLRVDFKRFFLNSLFVNSIITPVSVLTSTWVGFVLAKYEFRGKTLVFYAIMSTLMLPGAMLLIPRYQVVLWLKLLNTFMALIVPAMFTSFGIFMMRQFMHAVPNELLDAGRIDGASEPRMFFQVVLPLVRPAMAALAIFQFRTHWDDLLWPMIVVSREKLYTVPVGIAMLAARSEPQHAHRNAAAFISIVPMVVVFLLFQRHIVRGIALTGMGGT